MSFSIKGPACESAMAAKTHFVAPPFESPSSMKIVRRAPHQVTNFPR